MRTFADMSRKLQALKFNAIVVESLTGLEDVIEKLNQEQMRLGLDADGAELYALRSSSYAEWKQNEGSRAPFGVADFYNTGDFFRGMSVQITESAIMFDSSDPKTPELDKKSNSRMFGLTKESKTELKTEYLQNEFIMAVEMKLGL